MNAAYKIGMATIGIVFVGIILWTEHQKNILADVLQSAVPSLRSELEEGNDLLSSSLTMSGDTLAKAMKESKEKEQSRMFAMKKNVAQEQNPLNKVILKFQLVRTIEMNKFSPQAEISKLFTVLQPQSITNMQLVKQNRRRIKNILPAFDTYDEFIRNPDRDMFGALIKAEKINFFHAYILHSAFNEYFEESQDELLQVSEYQRESLMVLDDMLAFMKQKNDVYTYDPESNRILFQNQKDIAEFAGYIEKLTAIADNIVAIAEKSDS